MPNVNKIEPLTNLNPLTLSISSGLSEIALLLMGHEEVNPNIVSLEEKSVLYHVCERGWRDVVEGVLDKWEGDVNELQTEEETALSIAIIKKREDVCQLLVQRGAKIDVPHPKSFLVCFSVFQGKIYFLFQEFISFLGERLSLLQSPPIIPRHFRALSRKWRETPSLFPR